MIKKPVAFVLGAGAMQPYGFPIGWELVSQVLGQFSGNTQQRHSMLEHTDFREAELDKFLKALDWSGHNSVDAFLEQRGEYLQIGLTTMSMVLMRCEQASSLYRERNPNANWLRYLLREMRSDTFDGFNGLHPVPKTPS